MFSCGATWRRFRMKIVCVVLFFNKLCATPTPATMVRYNRVQYQERKNNLANLFSIIPYKSICSNFKFWKYEDHLHGIITPQCLDKMLSNNTFWKLEFNRYMMVCSLSKKSTWQYVQRMLEMSSCLYTGKSFHANFCRSKLCDLKLQSDLSYSGHDSPRFIPILSSR